MAWPEAVAVCVVAMSAAAVVITVVLVRRQPLDVSHDDPKWEITTTDREEPE